ncbi:MAG: hypothetical protein SGARI_005100, partial [Bacillariaceae sp.]
MIPSLNRSFTWLLTGTVFLWSQLFLLLNSGGDLSSLSSLQQQGNRNLVNYDDYVRSFKSLRRNTTTTTIVTDSDSTTTAIGLEQQPRYRRSNTLPEWMKDYFDWHREIMIGLNETNVQNNKYIILRCTKNERKCGGVADRLKSLPFFIAAAARSKRVFMIRWDRPKKLEEFLLPNEVNWSVPDWMIDKIDNKEISSHMRPHGSNVIKIYKREKSTVLESLLQDFYGGSALYYRVQAELNDDSNNNSTGLDPNEVAKGNYAGWNSYETIFHDLFRSLFKPSLPIARLVQEKMESANLTAGNYVSCHHRAFYAIEDKKHKRKSRHLQKKALNAVNCASNIMPGATVYFASDSQQSIDAVRHLAKNRHRPIVTIHEDTEEALHLDKADEWESRHPSEYYPTFVDLLLMANGRCTAYGEGGFGRFASLLSYNASCIVKHNVKHETDQCRWSKAIESISETEKA